MAATPTLAKMPGGRYRLMARCAARFDPIHKRHAPLESLTPLGSRFQRAADMQGIIVFMFACWDEEIRPRIAEVRGLIRGSNRGDKVKCVGVLRLKYLPDSPSG
jgi:hypothetical protein